MKITPFQFFAVGNHTWVVDADGNMGKVTATGLTRSGLTMPDFIGKNVDEINPHVVAYLNKLGTALDNPKHAQFFQNEQQPAASNQKKNSGKAKTAKPNVIEVIRFIRPDHGYYIDANMYGVTLAFTLDYELRKVHVGISICNGDNFEKDTGVALASTYRHNVTNLDMPKSFNGCLVKWFMDAAPTQIFEETASTTLTPSIINNLVGIFAMSKYAEDQ